MTEQAERTDWWKVAIVAVIIIEALGGLSGYISNSGFGNSWFDKLQKPSFMPPGWLFGVVWPILYALIGIAFALVATAPQSRRRDLGLTLFLVQLGLNFVWSPTFFAGHDIRLANVVIFVMAAIAAVTARMFLKIRKAAGWLMVPYLAWLVFAATLNATIDRLNPGAGTSLLG